MGFFSNIGNKLKSGIGHIGNFVRSNIGMVTPVIHKIGEASRSSIGEAVLSKVPYGEAIKKGINMADVAATLYDSTGGFSKLPSIEEGKHIFAGIRGSLGK